MNQGRSPALAAYGRPSQSRYWVFNPAARSPAPSRPSDIPPLWRDDRGPLAITVGMERTTAVRTVASLGATDSLEFAAHADSDATQAVAPRRCSEP